MKSDKSLKAVGMPIKTKTKFEQMMDEEHASRKRRDDFISPKWNSMTAKERLDALNVAGVLEKDMFGNIVLTREDMVKLEYSKLPHYAKTDLAFHYFNLNRKGYPVESSPIKMKTDARIIGVGSYVVSKELGIPVDGVVGTYVKGRGKDYSIVGYMQGQTFTTDSVAHIDDKVKAYSLVVSEFPEEDSPTIFAINDQLAKRIAMDYLKPNTDFELYEKMASMRLVK